MATTTSRTPDSESAFLGFWFVGLSVFQIFRFLQFGRLAALVRWRHCCVLCLVICHLSNLSFCTFAFSVLVKVRKLSNFNVWSVSHLPCFRASVLVSSWFDSAFSKIKKFKCSIPRNCGSSAACGYKILMHMSTVL